MRAAARLGGIALACACRQPLATVSVQAVHGMTPRTPAPASAARYQPIDPIALEGGARGVISNGKRIVLLGGATRAIATPGVDRAEAIPPGLGGGYVFAGHEGTFFATRFDGELLKLWDEDDFDVGYKSVLLLHGPHQMKELPSGRAMLLPLPKLEQLVVHPTGLYALAETEGGDVFFSEDVSRNAPWRKILAGGGARVASDGSQLYYAKAQQPESEFLPSVYQWTAIDAHGAPSGDPVITRGLPPPAPGELAHDPYEPLFRNTDTTVLMNRDVAVTFDGVGDDQASGNEALLFLDAHSARVKRRSQFPHARCHMLKGGMPVLLGCYDAHSEVVWRIDSPEAEPVVDRPFGERVSFERAFGNVLVGTETWIDPITRDSAPRALHIRHPDGHWERLAVTANTPPLHLGVHWVGYGDGRIVGIDHATSEWLLIDPRGNRIAHVAEGIRFDLGAPWADPAVDGVGFFAQLQGQEHTLLELRFDGTLREAKLPASASDAERWPAIWKDERARTAKTSGAMGPIGIAGARALLALADGSLLESLDFGHSWHPVEGPPGGGPISELRCAEAGCLIDGFYRVGWGFE